MGGRSRPLPEQASFLGWDWGSQEGERVGQKPGPPHPLCERRGNEGNPHPPPQSATIIPVFICLPFPKSFTCAAADAAAATAATTSRPILGS